MGVEDGGYGGDNDDDAGGGNGPKLREMQIAYEFERVQAQDPLNSPEDDDDGVGVGGG